MSKRTLSSERKDMNMHGQGGINSTTNIAQDSYSLDGFAAQKQGL